MKEKSLIKPLTPRQLFGIKKENLERKVIDYYEATQDAASVVEYAVAILVRNAMVVSDFTGLFQALIVGIFMNAEPSEELRKHCVYFKDYFKSGDWEQVIRRLFGNKKNFHQFTKTTRIYAQRLKAPRDGKRKYLDLQLRMVAIFEDASGKRHTLTIRDAEEMITRSEAEGILEILTTRSVFKMKGVRRFAKFVKVSRPGTTDTIDDEQIEAASAIEEDTRELRTIEIIAQSSVDLTDLTEEETLKLVRGGHPDITDLAGIQVVFRQEEQESMVEEDTVFEPKVQAIEEIRSDPQEKGKRRRPLTAKQAYVQGLLQTFRKRTTSQRE